MIDQSYILTVRNPVLYTLHSAQIAEPSTAADAVQVRTHRLQQTNFWEIVPG